jgi:hypothetical protein
MTHAELDTSLQQDINLEDEVKREQNDPKANTKDQREQYKCDYDADLHQHLHDHESFDQVQG